MIDIDLIRTTPKVVEDTLKKRNLQTKVPLVQQLKKADGAWRTLKSEIDELRAKRNRVSQDINEAKKSGKDVKAVIAKAKKIPEELEKHEKRCDALRPEIDTLLIQIPNILDKDVPTGKSADDNKIVSEWGKIPKFNFELKTHTELCESLDIAEFERSAKISGRGFYFLKNELMLLEQALIRFALDTLHKKNFTLSSVPYMMRKESYSGVTDLATFNDALYKIDNDDQYLIATSEHPLTAQFMDEIIEDAQLPIKRAALSACFRKEAGGHGVDEKGLFRVHQFHKVEQVVLCKQEDSAKWHEDMLKNA